MRVKGEPLSGVAVRCAWPSTSDGGGTISGLADREVGMRVLRMGCHRRRVWPAPPPQAVSRDSQDAVPALREPETIDLLP